MSRSDYEDGLRGAGNWIRDGQDKKDWEAGHRDYLRNQDLVERLEEAREKSEEAQRSKSDYSSSSYSYSSDSSSDGTSFHGSAISALCLIAYFVGSVGGCMYRWSTYKSVSYAYDAFASTGVAWALAVACIYIFILLLVKSSSKPAVVEQPKKYHPVFSSMKAPWAYCCIADCKCDHPKRCENLNCKCSWDKVCYAGDGDCACGFPKVCRTPSHDCGRPKLATSKYCTRIS